MRKLFTITALVAAMCMTAACQKEIEVSVSDEDSNIESPVESYQLVLKVHSKSIDEQAIVTASNAGTGEIISTEAVDKDNYSVFDLLSFEKLAQGAWVRFRYTNRDDSEDYSLILPANQLQANKAVFRLNLLSSYLVDHMENREVNDLNVNFSIDEINSSYYIVDLDANGKIDYLDFATFNPDIQTTQLVELLTKHAEIASNTNDLKLVAESANIYYPFLQLLDKKEQAATFEVISHEDVAVFIKTNTLCTNLKEADNFLYSVGDNIVLPHDCSISYQLCFDEIEPECDSKRYIVSYVNQLITTDPVIVDGQDSVDLLNSVQAILIEELKQDKEFNAKLEAIVNDSNDNAATRSIKACDLFIANGVHCTAN